MIDLDFAVQDITVEPHAAVPLLSLRLRISSRPADVAIEHVSLSVQIRIEAAHRGYAAGERERLSELFGAEADWDRTMRSLLWTNLSVSVPAFQGECTAELKLPCSHDFNVAVTKYFLGVDEGQIPLLLLFSGSVFSRDADGDLQIGPVAHHKEASHRLPARLWRAMMEHYYPDTVWLRIGRDLFDDLCRYKRLAGCTTLEHALRTLLEAE